MSMPYEERRAVYEAAIGHFGAERQVVKAIEEMAELTKELAKCFCPGETTLEKLVDEMADVTVMVEQLRLIFEVNDAVQARIDFKVHRLEQRINAQLEKEDRHVRSHV